MKNLYGSISISKELKQGNEEIREKINYYKIKDEKYGLEIEKKYANDTVERTNLSNITDSEEKIDDLLKELVYKEVTPCSDGAIEDFVKQHI